MPALRLDVVTAERLVYSDDVASVVAPGSEGELTLLPRHAALMTTLQPGALRVHGPAGDVDLAIGGGFLEVRDNRVLVLADSAERAEEIDIERAHAAEERARRLIAERGTGTTENLVAAEAALRRSQVRLKVARRRRSLDEVR
ncbi:MAG TPA: F0F1 ATP synthase subunit epsilon [Chloroflexota bacterium]|nr:F0F1 ATP synthase subunit epsilon [Chloroflexota bacterium]